MNITVCELDDDEEAFLAGWTNLVQHASASRSDLVVLPEMPFAPWFAVSDTYDESIWRNAEAAHEGWIGRLHELAPAVVVSSRPVSRSGRRFNEGFIWSPRGGYRPVHDKRFLPDEAGFWEAKWYAPGDGTFDVATAEVGTGDQSRLAIRIGMLICTELWSLGHAQQYGKAGAQIIATPRATGRPTVDKWLVGGRAAAIVSGAFSVSSNRSAPAGGGDFGGCGWIIDPDGVVVARTSRDQPVKTVAIDLAAADAAKRTYPRYAIE
jgi:N-carbamoylputrescine amidase